MTNPDKTPVELPYQVPNDIGNWAWWIFFDIFLVIALFLILTEFHFDGWWAGLGVFILAFAGSLGLLKLHPYLLLTEEGICYREFFFLKKVAWSDIKKVRTLSYLKYINSRPYPHMRIQHVGKRVSNPLIIGIKVFTREGLIHLAETLAQKCPEVMVNDKTVDMLTGRMPSMFDDLLDEYKAKNEK